jgi:hypothetical protein
VFAAMKKLFVRNIAGLLGGILFLFAYFNSQRSDGDPNYPAIMLIAPAAILVLIQLIVWWSVAFSPKNSQKRK